jgi:hypothetical protein
MRWLGEALQLLGAVLVCAGATVLAPWLGLLVAGAALVAVGYLIEEGRDGGTG